ncbi:MAG TPA: hypothetical protein PK762_03630 [Candidatus Kapabacteria bacterium]|nr:hypothetical protein [Candidatus Kapabacteria bacterium]
MKGTINKMNILKLMTKSKCLVLLLLVFLYLASYKELLAQFDKYPSVIKYEGMNRDSSLYKRLYFGTLNNISCYLNYLKIQIYEKELKSGKFDSQIFCYDDDNTLDFNKIYTLDFDETNFNSSLDSIYTFYSFDWGYKSYYEICYIDTNDKVSVNLAKGFNKNYDTTHSVLVLQSSTGWHFNSYSSFYIPIIIQHGLLGINKKTNKLIFLSGFMFLNDIKEEFFKGILDSTKVKEYVRIRYYCYGYKDIISLKANEDNTKYEIIIGDIYNDKISKYYIIEISYDKELNKYYEKIERIEE